MLCGKNQPEKHIQMYNRNVRASGDLKSSHFGHDDLSHTQNPRIPAQDSVSQIQGRVPAMVNWDGLMGHGSCVPRNRNEAKCQVHCGQSACIPACIPQAFTSFILVPSSEAPSHFKCPENMFNQNLAIQPFKIKQKGPANYIAQHSAANIYFLIKHFPNQRNPLRGRSSFIRSFPKGLKDAL